MPKSVNDRRKERVKQADFHLFTAIDAVFPLWREIYPTHKEYAHDLRCIMYEIETARYHLLQFYKLLWGGKPPWMLKGTEVSDRIREQRREWAIEREKCRQSESD